MSTAACSFGIRVLCGASVRERAKESVWEGERGAGALPCVLALLLSVRSKGDRMALSTSGLGEKREGEWWRGKCWAAGRE
jgi:hypothetical protein